MASSANPLTRCRTYISQFLFVWRAFHLTIFISGASIIRIVCVTLMNWETRYSDAEAPLALCIFSIHESVKYLELARIDSSLNALTHAKIIARDT